MREDRDNDERHAIPPDVCVPRHAKNSTETNLHSRRYGAEMPRGYIARKRMVATLEAGGERRPHAMTAHQQDYTTSSVSAGWKPRLRSTSKELRDVVLFGCIKPEVALRFSLPRTVPPIPQCSNFPILNLRPAIFRNFGASN